MPGFLYHLACAKIVADKWYADTLSDYDLFLMGNLLPDLAENYDYAHYWQTLYLSEIDPFDCRLKTRLRYGIELRKAQVELTQDGDPLKLGIFFHLYIDDHVKIYNDDAVGLEFIRRGLVPIRKIFTLPLSLPKVGSQRFDNRNGRCWRDEIENILANPPERHYVRGDGWQWYTGNLDTVIRFTMENANKFAKNYSTCI